MIRIGLLAKKVGMSRFYDESGRNHSATILETDNCRVIDIKDKTKVGYSAVRLSFGSSPKKTNKPAKGFLKKKNIFFEFEKGSINEEFFRNEIIKNLNVKLDNNEFNRIWNLVILNINTDVLESIFKLRNRFSLMVLSNTNSIHKNYFEYTLSLKFF